MVSDTPFIEQARSYYKTLSAFRVRLSQTLSTQQVQSQLNQLFCWFEKSHQIFKLTLKLVNLYSLSLLRISTMRSPTMTNH